MRYRMTFVVGLAVGYVLGSRAGRERYEQIKQTAQRVADNPKVQGAAGLVGAQVSKAAEVARHRVGDTLQHRIPFLGEKEHRTDDGTGWPEKQPEQQPEQQKAGKSGIPY
ncbi:YtxH domain-containing protein [Nonomuraea sp. NPDC048916]|uniref:YtxH domain-containing protein n=1 Tax=Nonomuraea sp. NPDC048916 TaxID=3154232 RepID=UPI0033EE5627